MVEPDVLEPALELLPWALGSLWLTMIAGVYQAGLDGYQRMDLRTTLVMMSTILYLLLALAFVPAHGLMGLAWAQLVQSAVLLVATAGLLKLKRFGYATDVESEADVPDLTRHISATPSLSRLPFRPPSSSGRDGGVSRTTAAWAHDLDAEKLDRLGLGSTEQAVLIHSLRGWLAHETAAVDARLQGLLTGPAAEPSWFQLQLLRRSRRLSDLRGITPLFAGRTLLDRVKQLRR